MPKTTTSSTHIVLFHSGLGLRPHVGVWRTALQAEGFEVHTPDLYDGEVFDDLERGVAKRDAIGIPELSRRASAAVEHLPSDVIYAGFSLGAASAQALALMRPGARGLVLMHAALPLAAFGSPPWPKGLRAQFHASIEDPWVDAAAVDSISEAAPDGAFEAFRYDGSAHLFADSDSSEFNATHARTMSERVRAFVHTL